MPKTSKPQDANRTVKSNLAEQSRPSKQAKAIEQKLQNLIALEFEMALYYAQPWHGDVSNAIIKAEQALEHQLMLLRLQGKGSEDPSLNQFYHLLVTIYELKAKDFKEPRFSSEVEPINQEIADKYKQRIKGKVDFKEFPESLTTLSRILNPKLVDQMAKKGLDTTKAIRAEIKDELAYKYYRGLGLGKPGYGSVEELHPGAVADLHRILALAFLEQPDANNAIVHAEHAKEMMLALLHDDEKHPAMKDFYRTLHDIYGGMPNRADYAADEKYYLDKLNSVRKVHSPKM